MPADRPIRLLVAGGTIVMAGSPARPSPEVIAQLQARAGVQVEPELFAAKPSVHFTPAEALTLCRRAVELARTGTPVVITHGTDLLEEVAFMCDLLYDGTAPIVFTGAMRTASAPGADGPANLADAAALAGDPAAAGLGVLVTLAGTVHAARHVRKADSTSVAAFTSPQTGPLGHLQEGRFIRRWACERRRALDVAHLDATVEILTPGLGSTPALVHAAGALCHGLVLSLPGAGHSPPAFLQAAQAIAREKPVVAVARPWRGALLHDTYGFEGAEVDLRSGAIACAGSLSAPAARIAVLACLGAGLTTAETKELLEDHD